MDPIILYVERRDRREIYGRSIEYDEFLFLNHWPLQEPKFDWRYRFHLFLAKKFQAYFLREYPSKIWPYMIQYLHFRILKFPLTEVLGLGWLIKGHDLDKHYGKIWGSPSNQGLLLI